MSGFTTRKPITTALGAAFATALCTAPMANAQDNPFSMTALSSGYQVAADDTTTTAPAKGMQGACGGRMKPGEGMCGMRAMDADGDGKVTQAEFDKHHQNAFTIMDTNKDGVLDKSEVGKMMGEGKCGEGKCGAGGRMTSP